MNNFKIKLGTAFTIATVAATLLAPVSLASSTITNTQTNVTTVNSSVLVVSNSGLNEVSGGGGTVNTGGTYTLAGVLVTGSQNNADITGCGCAGDPATSSPDKTGGPKGNSNSITNTQINATTVTTKTGVITNTGLNEVNGGKKGTTSVTTGVSKTAVITVVTGSKNNVTIK